MLTAHVFFETLLLISILIWFGWDYNQNEWFGLINIWILLSSVILYVLGTRPSTPPSSLHHSMQSGAHGSIGSIHPSALHIWFKIPIVALPSQDIVCCASS